MDKVELIDRVKVAESVARLAIPIDCAGDSDHRIYLLGYNQAVRHAVCLIRAATTIDAASMRRGEWVMIDEHCNHAKTYECTACRRAVELDHYARRCDYNFCPYCGADMRGETNESLNCL